jgi:hypothetical protein
MTLEGKSYRAKAVEARSRADKASDPALRWMWQQLAEELDRKADLEDRQPLWRVFPGARGA